MTDNEKLTIYDRLFGDSRHFVYPLDGYGRPDYGYITLGGQKIKIVKIEIWDIGGVATEKLFLENRQCLRGRERVG